MFKTRRKGLGTRLKQPDAANSSSSVRFKQCDKLNCEPVKIKEEVTVDDEICRSGNLDNDVWVKCNKSVLKCEDKKIIETGDDITDKITQYSQYLVKKQFSTIGGLHSTLLQNHHKERLPDNSLQVVHCSARHHWILASNIDHKKGVVNIYNSLFTSLDEETFATVNSYFGEKGNKRKVQYRMQEVQKQIVECLQELSSPLWHTTRNPILLRSVKK